MDDHPLPLPGPAATIRMAGPADADGLLALARRFHAEDGHPLGPAGEQALRRLLSDRDAGLAWIVEGEGHAVGYVVLCFGFSIEWGGRDAFIDDLYLDPAWRGRGLGSAIIEIVGARARQAGALALHLEVLPGNPAEALYRRLGFQDRGSAFLSRRLLDEG